MKVATTFLWMILPCFCWSSCQLLVGRVGEQLTIAFDGEGPGWDQSIQIEAERQLGRRRRVESTYLKLAWVPICTCGWAVEAGFKPRKYLWHRLEPFYPSSL